MPTRDNQCLLAFETEDPWAAFDGRLNAPADGAFQFPTLLNSYPFRPPWQVAGIDYPVGYSTSTVFKDPSTQGPVGTNFDAPTRALGIIADNVTLDGFDFTLHNGIQLQIGGNNCIIQNCKFGGSTIETLGTWIIFDGGLNTTIRYCDLNGGGTGALPLVQSGMIAVWKPPPFGTFTLQYCYMHQYPQHVVEVIASATLDYRYNFLGDTLITAGAHGNVLQWAGSLTGASPLVTFNTAYQTQDGESGLFQLYCNGNGTMNNCNCSNNTIMYPSTLQTIGDYPIQGTDGYPGGVTTVGLPCFAQQNYCDPTSLIIPGTAGKGLLWPGSMINWTIAGNIDMRNGNSLNDAS